MRTALLLASSLWITACVGEDDKPGGAWSPGKADGAYDVIEAGPAEFGKTAITLDHRLPALRVVSHGDTELAIDLRGPGGADAYLVVEGPLADDGDGEAAGTGQVVADDDDGGDGTDAHLEVTLAEPGVYRILTGTYQAVALGAAPEGDLELELTCRAGCARPALDQKELVATLRAGAGGDAAFVAMAEAALAGALPGDAALASVLSSQLRGILADPELRGLDRFPTLALADLGAVRPLIGLIEATPPAPDQVVTGDLRTVLGPCRPERTGPAPVDPRLPGLGNGHFADVRLSPCQAAHATTLAQVLTSLAAGNGSQVSFQGESITTPRQLMAALLASGHTIEVRNERTYANFISLTLGARDVIWPVWLDTGIPLSSGGSLTIPMGHSHHAWRIRGPVVDTRVMFYLGISGAGFFAQDHVRPAWTGERVATQATVSADAAEDAGYLLATVEAATTYLQRNRVERTTVAAGLPADGYGVVGVCNDSNAALEYVTRGTITAFPLLRAAALDAGPALGDGLDAAMRALPNDGDGLADVDDARRRALAMQPHDAGAEAMWDSQLAADLATARADEAMR